MLSALDRPAYISNHYLFEYFSPSRVRSYEIFKTEQKECGTVHYMTPQERICSWKEFALKIISYCTLIIPLIVLALQFYLAPQGQFELWSADKHFQIEDIERLGCRTIGLRHVSSQERALTEKREGFSLGCSFNLTPLPMGNFDQLSQRETLQKLFAYEKAVNGHFTNSFITDNGPIEPKRTQCSDIYDRLKNCCFMMIDYNCDNTPTDFATWSGLGRYPKWTVPAQQIKALLPFFDHKRLSTAPETITSKAEGERFFDALFDLWRADLLKAIRTNLVA